MASKILSDAPSGKKFNFKKSDFKVFFSLTVSKMLFRGKMFSCQASVKPSILEITCDCKS